MNDGSSMEAIYFALLLILPVAALVARRVPLSKVALYALAWIGIAAAAFAIVMLLGLGKPKAERAPASGATSIEGRARTFG